MVNGAAVRIHLFRFIGFSYFVHRLHSTLNATPNWTPNYPPPSPTPCPSLHSSNYANFIHIYQ